MDSLNTKSLVHVPVIMAMLFVGGGVGSGVVGAAVTGDGVTGDGVVESFNLQEIAISLIMNHPSSSIIRFLNCSWNGLETVPREYSCDTGITLIGRPLSGSQVVNKEELESAVI